MKMSLPTVSSEGGPILIGDYERVLEWRGIEDGGSDYTLACSKVAESDLNKIDDRMLVWDFGGPGTGWVLFQNDAFIFIRTWANEEIDDDDILRFSSEIIFQPTDLNLALSSGAVLFVWAPEDGASITSIPGAAGLPIGDFSMGGTAHFQKIGNGLFQAHSAKGIRNEIEFTALKIDRIS